MMTKAKYDKRHYPPGDLPELSPDEWEKLKNKPKKTAEDLAIIRRVELRAARKDGWLIDQERPDKVQRQASAAGTLTESPLSDILNHVAPFIQGRPPGAYGSLTKLIRAELPAYAKSNMGKIKPREVWVYLASSNKVDFEFSGKPNDPHATIWLKQGSHSADYKTFSNIVHRAAVALGLSPKRKSRISVRKK